jgi:hypothetical protein
MCKRWQVSDRFLLEKLVHMSFDNFAAILVGLCWPLGLPECFVAKLVEGILPGHKGIGQGFNQQQNVQ